MSNSNTLGISPFGRDDMLGQSPLFYIHLGYSGKFAGEFAGAVPTSCGV
jgi:hypothetical protein